MHYFKKILLVVVSVSLFNSCNSLSNKEQKNLENKVFYLQKFTYVGRGINKQKAMKIMENFPVDKILKILGNKYNINMDTSEYEDFLALEDSSKLIAGGLLYDTEYIWENNNKNENVVEIEYRKDFITNEGQFLEPLSYIILLKTGKKTIDKYYGDLFGTVPHLLTIAGAMGYSRVDKNSDDKYMNNETKAVIDLTSGIFGKKISQAKAVKVSQEKIKEDIRIYVKSLSPEDRKKFREDIFKFLYKIIE